MDPGSNNLSNDSNPHPPGNDNSEADGNSVLIRRRRETGLHDGLDSDTTTTSSSFKRTADKKEKGMLRVFIKHVLLYVFELLGLVMHILRIPLSILLVLGLFYYVGKQLHALMIPTSLSFLLPACKLPLLARLNFCPDDHRAVAVQPYNINRARIDFPSLTQFQVNTFGELLDGSTSSSNVGLELKKAEAATSDLAVIVQISQLGCREALADALILFGSGATKAGRSIIILDAKIKASVDRIVAMNDYSLRQMSKMAETVEKHPDTHTDPVPDISSLFKDAMSFTGSELRSLITAAEATLRDLNELEEQLKTIHTIVAFEEVSLSDERDKLLSDLWTLLGGNRKERRRFEYNLALLDKIAEYRKYALAYVISTLQTLQEKSAELEVLRGKVLQSSLSEEEGLPLEVHIHSIRAGIQRLLGDKNRNRFIGSGQGGTVGEGAQHGMPTIRVAKAVSSEISVMKVPS